jgi:hypothetical protein
MRAERLDRILHRQRVHHGGEHAHLVGGDPIHAGPREPRATKDVAAADDHRDLDAECGHIEQFHRDAAKHGGIDAVVDRAQQGLARQFHQYALACPVAHGWCLIDSSKKNPAAAGFMFDSDRQWPLPLLVAWA